MTPRRAATCAWLCALAVPPSVRAANAAPDAVPAPSAPGGPTPSDAPVGDPPTRPPTAPDAPAPDAPSTAGAGTTEPAPAPWLAPVEEVAPAEAQPPAPAPPPAPRSPTLPASAFLHDGVFARASMGPALFLAQTSTTPDTRHFSGATLAVDLAVGGTPAPGLVLGAAYQTNRVMAPRVRDDVVDGDEPDLHDVRFAFDVLGAFVDFYPDPRKGLHFQALAGLGALRVDQRNGQHTEEPDGVVLSAGVGYERFVGRNVSLGVVARATVGWLSVAETELSTRTTELRVIVPAVLAVVTIN